MRNSINLRLLSLTLLLCLFPTWIIAQSLSIKGSVKDTMGEPIIGANVLIAGTTNGIITDIDGNFTLTVPKNGELVISYIGYQTQTVKLNKQTTIEIILKEDAEALEEVVVVGYGSQKKATLTGSIANVAGAEIAKSPSVNLGSSLAGKLPGLIVNQRSGQPGDDDPSMKIRGRASFASDNGPLVIIDGMERGNMTRLNPDDIESYTVLKDASAAIYGARAANGVILITTKKGTKGKPQFSFSQNVALSAPTVKPKVLNSAEYAEAFNEGYWYRLGRPESGYTPYYSDEAIQKYRDGSDPVLYPNTNWLDETMKSHSMQYVTSMQVTGGTDKVSYLLSYRFLKQGSGYHHNPIDYRQHTVRANISVEMNDYLTIGANISAMIRDRMTTPTYQSDNFWNIVHASPTLVARYPNGLIGPGRLTENPLLLDRRGYQKMNNTPVSSSFTATLKIPYIKGLKVEGSFNYDFNNQFQKNVRTPYTYHEYNVNTGEYEEKKGTGSNSSVIQVQDESWKWTTLMWNTRLVYETTIKENHNISAMLGIEQQQGTSNWMKAYRKNFLTSLLPDIDRGSSAAEDKDNGGNSGRDGRNNYFGRLNYDYRSKYMAEFIFRYDGSHKFPAGKRYGFFPAASFGWRISEEPFMKNLFPDIDQLKLRFSAGQTGYDSVDAYQHLQTYSIGGNYVFGTTDTSGIQAGVMPNSDITWEVSTKYDLGFEGGFKNGLIGFNLTLFQENRSSILASRNLSIPGTLGFTGLPNENIGKTRNRGFELELSHRNRVNKDFFYEIIGNIAYAKSKIIYMDETPNTFEYRNQTGRPIGADLFYKADGIFHTQEELDNYPHAAGTQVGDIKIVDLNKDGKIDSDDQYRFGYTNTPRTVFGLTTNFQYKNLDLSLFFQGQAGAYNYDDRFEILGNASYDNAYAERAKNRWTVDNPNGTMPRSDGYQPGKSTFYLQDATFIRLKSAELGYTLPKIWISKIGLTDLRVYVSGFNLLTWAKEIKHIDPEISDGSLNYPQQRVINFGLNVKF